MPRARKTVTYALHEGRKKVYIGTTDNPDRRVREHEAEGKRFTRMDVTSRRMTEEGAKGEEDAQLASYRSSHRGRNPRYNETKSG